MALSYEGGIVGENSGTISTTVTATNINGVTVDGSAWRAGGIAGNNSGTISGITVGSNTLVKSTSSSVYAGGIVGYNNSTGVINADCTTDADVSCTEGYYGYVIGCNIGGTVDNDITCLKSAKTSDSYSISASSTKIYATITLERTSKVTLSVTDESGGGAIYGSISNDTSTLTSTGKVDGTTVTKCAGYLTKGTYYIKLNNQHVLSASSGTVTYTID